MLPGPQSHSKVANDARRKAVIGKVGRAYFPL